MPIIKSLMRSLKKQYGPEKGEQMYYALENKRKHGLADSLTKRRKKS
jgi:hypothetical protein